MQWKFVSRADSLASPRDLADVNWDVRARLPHFAVHNGPPAAMNTALESKHLGEGRTGVSIREFFTRRPH